jgi:hypothetical protein
MCFAFFFIFAMVLDGTGAVVIYPLAPGRHRRGHAAEGRPRLEGRQLLVEFLSCAGDPDMTLLGQLRWQSATFHHTAGTDAENAHGRFQGG